MKWSRVKLDLICPEGSVIKGKSRFYYVFKVKWLRVYLDFEDRAKDNLVYICI